MRSALTDRTGNEGRLIRFQSVLSRIAAAFLPKLSNLRQICKTAEVSASDDLELLGKIPPRFDYGQPSLPWDRLKPKRHNAKSCPFAKRQRIANTPPNSDSKHAIAPAFHVRNNTVSAILEQESPQAVTRKQRLAAQFEHSATPAAERLIGRISRLADNLLISAASVKSRGSERLHTVI